jgi:hypothetical protein
MYNSVSRGDDGMVPARSPIVSCTSMRKCFGLDMLDDLNSGMQRLDLLPWSQEEGCDDGGLGCNWRLPILKFFRSL